MNRTAQYPQYRWLLLVAAVFAQVTMQVSLLSIAPILPQVAKDLNIGLGTATNFMAVFLFSGAIVILFIGGVVCDRFGVEIAIILSLACATIPATLMPWIGTNYHVVLWARMVQGLSGGFIIPAGGCIVALWFPEKEKGRASGVVSASMAIGSALGLLGGPAVFSVTRDWKTMSAILSIFGWVALAFVLSITVFHKQQPPVESHPLPTPTNGVAFRGALVAPLTWFGITVFFMAAWSTQCLYGLTPGFLSADKPVGAGYGPMASGQLMLGATIAGILSPLLCGVLLDKVFHGKTTPINVVGFALASACSYALLIHWVVGKVVATEIALVLAGLGVQVLFPSIILVIANSYPTPIVGRIVGLWWGIGNFGGVLGLYVGGVTLRRTGNYHLAILLMAVSALLGLILAVMLSRQKPLVSQSTGPAVPDGVLQHL